MEKPVDPLVGRAAELNEYATSDLSVEENLASGASVDDLVAAGVLYDDYDPDNNPVYSFTPERSLEEIAAEAKEAPKASKMSEEEFQAKLREHFKHGRMAEEHRKEANRRATWT